MYIQEIDSSIRFDDTVRQYGLTILLDDMPRRDGQTSRLDEPVVRSSLLRNARPYAEQYIEREREIEKEREREKIFKRTGKKRARNAKSLQRVSKNPTKPNLKITNGILHTSYAQHPQ